MSKTPLWKSYVRDVRCLMLHTALSHVGRSGIHFLKGMGGALSLSIQALAATCTSRGALSISASQTVSTIARCFVPVCLVIGPISAMLAIQSLTLTRLFGVERLFAPLITVTIVRELAPGFSSVMVCFQAGAGISAELATMRTHEEIDAIEVMGLDPKRLLLGPRIIASMIAAPILSTISIFAGLFSSYVAAVLFLDMPRALFIDHIFDGLTLTDIWLSVFKCVIFGFGLGAISVTNGFFARPGPEGIGHATNRTVVAAVMMVMIANYILNTLFMGLRGGGVL